MIFRIDAKGKTVPYRSTWNPKELEVEKMLLDSLDDDEPVLDEAIFGEPLLFIANQVQTRSKKRADILAIDKAGNGVVIELKRDQGSMGVDTQALQYLADISADQGRTFLNRFDWAGEDNEKTIRGFLGKDVPLEDINKRSRVILLARGFDETLFSMGEWLSTAGVAFRCITYTPFEVGTVKLLSFAVAFDRSPIPIYRVAFRNVTREPGFYWHNIGEPDDKWWSHLKSTGQITASFDGQPGDAGERLLRGYIKGDTVIAFAKWYGAVGWGEITAPDSYHLVPPSSPEDKLKGLHLHRLSIKWRHVAPKLEEGIPAKKVYETFGIYWPVGTRAEMDATLGAKLRDELTKLFK